MLLLSYALCSSTRTNLAPETLSKASFRISFIWWIEQVVLVLVHSFGQYDFESLRAPETLSNASFWITFIWWMVHGVLVLVHNFGQYDFESLNASFWNLNIWLFVHCKFELAHSFGQHGALWWNASFWDLIFLLLLHVLEIRMFEPVHGLSQHGQLDYGGWPPWVEHGLLAT